MPFCVIFPNFVCLSHCLCVQSVRGIFRIGHTIPLACMLAGFGRGGGDSDDHSGEDDKDSKGAREVGRSCEDVSRESTKNC